MHLTAARSRGIVGVSWWLLATGKTLGGMYSSIDLGDI